MPRGLTPSERRPTLDRKIADREAREERPRTNDGGDDRRRGLLESLTPEAGLQGLLRSVEGDERPPRERVAPGDKEELPILIPGDPTALGARGKRRQDTDDESPVLRRALLGV